jgi:hypothetical protein
MKSIDKSAQRNAQIINFFVKVSVRLERSEISPNSETEGRTLFLK